MAGNRVVVFSQFGGPEVLRLEERPLAEPGAGEVRVRMAYAGLNPVDYKIRRGGSQYDTALPSLLAFAKPGRVLFGSDWPYAPAPAVSYFTGQLDAFAALDADGHAAIDHENASALFGKEA